MSKLVFTINDTGLVTVDRWEPEINVTPALLDLIREQADPRLAIARVENDRLIFCVDNGAAVYRVVNRQPPHVTARCILESSQGGEGA